MSEAHSRRVRGLAPRIETPHPPSLREGTFSHKGRREGSCVFECRYLFVAAFGQYLSRRCRFTSLPVGVRGSSASKSMLFGHLIGDRRLRQNTISSASRSFPALVVSCGCTTPFPSSPISSFVTPNTATPASSG